MLIVPGMMGSQPVRCVSREERAAGSECSGSILRRSAAGRLTDLALPSRRAIRPRGVLLSSYARLKLQLAIEGFDARFFAYDWRLGIDEIGAALAAAIAAAGKPAVLIAHSMGGSGRAHRAQALAETIGDAGSSCWERRTADRSRPCSRCAAPIPSCSKLSRLDLKHSPEVSGGRSVLHAFPASITCCRPQPSSDVDLLDPSSWPSEGPRPEAGAARSASRELGRGWRAPDARMVQIVGVNRETVVSVRRTPAGFEYGSSRNGDGTVPVALALLPGLKTYFAEESHGNLANNPRIIRRDRRPVRAGTTRGLCRAVRCRARSPEQRIDDARAARGPTRQRSTGGGSIRRSARR